LLHPGGGQENPGTVPLPPAGRLHAARRADDRRHEHGPVRPRGGGRAPGAQAGRRSRREGGNRVRRIEAQQPPPAGGDDPLRERPLGLPLRAGAAPRREVHPGVGPVCAPTRRRGDVERSGAQGVAMPGWLGRVIAARLLQSLRVMWVVVSAVFFLSRGIGDPISIMAPIGTPPAEIERIKDQEGLNDPLLEQYGRFLIDIAHGDFGKSFRANQPALTVVRSRIWASVELGLAAAFIALLVGIPIGVVAALSGGGSVGIGGGAVALLGRAIPGFWLGLMLILFFALRLGWLPTGGKGDWKTLILPAVTLAAPSAAAFVRLTRAAMLEVLG